MAKAEIITPPPVEAKIVLTLSLDEARDLRALFGASDAANVRGLESISEALYEVVRKVAVSNPLSPVSYKYGDLVIVAKED